MHNTIVKSSVIICKTVYNTVKISTSTTEQTVKTTIIATETTNNTLQLTTVKSPNTTTFIQVMFKVSGGARPNESKYSPRPYAST